ncbi:hypothetical protein CPC08DRAFT_703904 [Agrocybe pediades]|nr:hypothetical protein CPC08DRAFT_703904 [Agrocybe pediades]
MKFSAATFFVLFAAAASVLGQYDHGVDEMMAREFDFEELDARGVEHEIYVRQVEDITNVKCQLHQLERRTRAACYIACQEAYAKGTNRDNCYSKCDKMWGKNGSRHR